MLTLITGTPGAGKTLYAVSELARNVPGSTVENNGVAVPRRLLSNVKDLAIEHQPITADDLNKWHEWAQPGDVILFDEVQEVWRPRSLGKEVPPAIAALETHRHKGVDLILITQHPMLLDTNIRRLVNQHMHVRRIASGFSWLYEWDHCSNISTFKTAIQSRIWRYPKDVFSLYKSAQLHTKPVARIPRIAYVGIVALFAFIGLGKYAFDRASSRFQAPAVASKPLPDAPTVPPPAVAASAALATQAATAKPSPVHRPESSPSYAGCIYSVNDCRCFDLAGILVKLDRSACLEAANDPSIRLAGSGARSVGPSSSVPPITQDRADAGVAAAAPPTAF